MVEVTMAFQGGMPLRRGNGLASGRARKRSEIMPDLRTLAKRIVPKSIVRLARRVNQDWLMRYGTRSYSQEGEDIFLNGIFPGRRDGFYVDIGACHPVVYSNTHLFYRRGWHGINIDPAPGSKRLFDRARRRDTNLELAIGTSSRPLEFYLFENSVLNTFDAAQRDICVAGGSKRAGTVSVAVERLDAVLDRYLPKGQQIDFMNVDVEASELDVLGSNDWSRFRPKILCVEIFRVRIYEMLQHPVGRFLDEAGYEFFAKLKFTSFFREKAFIVP